EDVEAAERGRLDGEEVAGEHAGGLLAEEFAPAWARAPRRGPKAVGEQDPPDRARRDAQAELAQLAGDPRVAPAWVLAGEAQHEFLYPAIDWRTARTSPRLRPLATHELPKCQRRSVCGVTTSPWRRRGGSNRASAASKARSAGRSEGRGCCRWSTTKLMSQHEQLDVFSELAVPASDQQPQHSREGEIGEGKEHEADAS